MNSQREIVFQNDKGITRVPASEVEFNTMVVESKWGDIRRSSDLYKKLVIPKKIFAKAGTILENTDGTKTVLQEDTVLAIDEFLLSELNFWTQDHRLGYLKNKGKVIVRHYNLLAADFLRKGMYEACVVALNRSINELESSQSDDGNLRKELSTIRKMEGTIDDGRPKLPFAGKKN